MSDALEQELRAALAERASAMPDAADALARLRDADFHSASAASRSGWLPAWLPLWPALGGAAAAVGAAIATAVVLLSSGATPAYAGWTPVPTTPDPAALAAATAVCRPGAGPLLSTAMTGRLVLADQRGAYIAELYAGGGDTGVCITDAGRSGGGGGDSAVLGFYDAPGADQLGLPGGGAGGAPGFPGSSANGQLPPMQGLLDSRFFKSHPADRARLLARLHEITARGVETNIYGRAGSDIAAVSFTIYGDTTVQATVENGWYFAWWPGFAGGPGDRPVSVQVTTKSGTTLSSPMSGSGCEKSSSCVFAGVNQNSPLLHPTQATTTATATITTPGTPTAASTTTTPGTPTTTAPTAAATTPDSTTATSPATTAAGAVTTTTATSPSAVDQ